MKHITRKQLIATVMLGAGLSLVGCEKRLTPEEEAAIKADEDSVAATDEASEAGDEGGGGGATNDNR